MAAFPRYAIYYVAAPGSDLDRFGAQLLGYDAFSGEPLPFPDGVAPDWHELTRDPRQYGFHATLKPPLALAQGNSESELVAACEAFLWSIRSAALSQWCRRNDRSNWSGWPQIAHASSIRFAALSRRKIGRGAIRLP
jgi:hypothetical protein